MHYDHPKQNQDNLLSSYNAEHKGAREARAEPLCKDYTKEETSQAYLHIRYKTKIKSTIKRTVISSLSQDGTHGLQACKAVLVVSRLSSIILQEGTCKKPTQ